jgi:hypothetical protein
MAGWVHAALAGRVHVAYEVNGDTAEPMLPGATVLVWPGYEFGYAAGKILLDQIEGRANVQERVMEYLAIRDC